jgi:hemolysin D
MIPIRWQATTDLLRRYGTVFRAAWTIREQLEPPERLRYEVAFLPAHLELVEAPVHPAPRWTMRTIVVLALVALLISVYGRLDIVSVAKGKLVPGARVKVIQPAISGVVRQILVHDGQRVTAGQPLLALDTTQAAADADKARSARVDAALAAARSQALLDAQHDDRLPLVKSVEGATSAQVTDSQRFADGQYREYADKLEGARAELLKRQAELASTVHEVEKLRATAPLARQEASDYKSLAVDNYVAKHDYLGKEQTALEQEHELSAQQSHAQELAAGIVEQKTIIESTVSQFRREQLEALDKASQQFAQSNDERIPVKVC